MLRRPVPNQSHDHVESQRLPATVGRGPTAGPAAVRKRPMREHKKRVPLSRHPQTYRVSLRVLQLAAGSWKLEALLERKPEPDLSNPLYRVLEVTRELGRLEEVRIRRARRRDEPAAGEGCRVQR